MGSIWECDFKAELFMAKPLRTSRSLLLRFFLFFAIFNVKGAQVGNVHRREKPMSRRRPLNSNPNPNPNPLLLSDQISQNKTRNLKVKKFKTIPLNRRWWLCSCARLSTFPFHSLQWVPFFPSSLFLAFHAIFIFFTFLGFFFIILFMAHFLGFL